jgi:DNA-binding winged helix-turn-helix (wHTH) protein
MIHVFGDYGVDLRLYKLRRATVAIKIEPQVFDLLGYLLEHRDRLVSRQELFERLWPKQFVSDDALERCLGEVRKTLATVAACNGSSGPYAAAAIASSQR